MDHFNYAWAPTVGYFYQPGSKKTQLPPHAFEAGVSPYVGEDFVRCVRLEKQRNSRNVFQQFGKKTFRQPKPVTPQEAAQHARVPLSGNIPRVVGAAGDIEGTTFDPQNFMPPDEPGAPALPQPPRPYGPPTVQPQGFNENPPPPPMDVDPPQQPEPSVPTMVANVDLTTKIQAEMRDRDAESFKPTLEGVNQLGQMVKLTGDSDLQNEVVGKLAEIRQQLAEIVSQQRPPVDAQTIRAELRMIQKRIAEATRKPPSTDPMQQQMLHELQQSRALCQQLIAQVSRLMNRVNTNAPVQGAQGPELIAAMSNQNHQTAHINTAVREDRVEAVAPKLGKTVASVDIAPVGHAVPQEIPPQVQEPQESAMVDDPPAVEDVVLYKPTLDILENRINVEEGAAVAEGAPEVVKPLPTTIDLPPRDPEDRMSAAEIKKDRVLTKIYRKTLAARRAKVAADKDKVDVGDKKVQVSLNVKRDELKEADAKNTTTKLRGLKKEQRRKVGAGKKVALAYDADEDEERQPKKNR